MEVKTIQGWTSTEVGALLNVNSALPWGHGYRGLESRYQTCIFFFHKNASTILDKNEMIKK